MTMLYVSPYKCYSSKKVKVNFKKDELGQITRAIYRLGNDVIQVDNVHYEKTETIIYVDLFRNNTYQHSHLYLFDNKTGSLKSETFLKGNRPINKTFYWSNGNKMLEIPYNRHNRLDGIVKHYKEDGSLSSTYEAVDGVITGMEKVYKHGHLCAETPLVNNVRNGTARFFDMSGNLVKTVPFKNGVINGTVLIQNHNGPEEKIYENGVLKKQIRRKKDGKIDSITHYEKEDVRHGREILYFHKNSIQIRQWEHGVLRRSFLSDEDLRESALYDKNGKRIYKSVTLDNPDGTQTIKFYKSGDRCLKKRILDTRHLTRE